MAGNTPTDHEANTAGAFSDKILNRLARRIGDEWRDIAYELDFEDPEIQQIKAQVPQTETNYLVAVTFQILRRWRCRNDHLTDEDQYHRLKKVFQEIEKQSLVHQLEQLVDISAIKGVINEPTHLKKEVQTPKQDLEANKRHDQSGASNKSHEPEACLNALLSSTNTGVKQVELPTPLNSLSLVRGELWICYDDCIVYNLDLVEQRRVSFIDIAGIYSVKDTGNCVVIAADTGLFALSYTGERLKTIAAGMFTDVCCYNGHIYACCFDDSLIHVYHPRDWQKTKTIEIECNTGHVHSLHVTDTIVLACDNNDCIYNVDVSGEIISKHGFLGGCVGEFDGPRLCQADSNNSLLVADAMNHRLQLLNRNEWRALQLNPDDLRHPTGAVYTQGALYVSARYPNILRKYESTQ